MNEPFDLLLVDDDPVAIASLSRLLAGVGRIRFAPTGAEALALARESVPDMVLLDVEMPGASGFEVCAAIKSDPALADVAVIFVTGHHDLDEELTGLSLGAVDFISKPPRGPLVVARVKTHLRLKQMSDALRRSATSDGLTGVANRRAFDDRLAREWSRSQRNGSPLGLLMIDIDHFKAYNDHYGHVVGDHCLREVAHALRDAVWRPADLLARYGGEEFVMLLPETDAEGVLAVANRALQAVEALRQPHAASPVADWVTVSIGGAQYVPDKTPTPSQTCQATDVLVAADRALYAAKLAGRRQVQVGSVSTAQAPVNGMRDPARRAGFPFGRL